MISPGNEYLAYQGLKQERDALRLRVAELEAELRDVRALADPFLPPTYDE